MDKRHAGMLGAVAGLAAIGSAQAAQPAALPQAAPQPASYADLLAPIPNAGELLQQDNAARAAAKAAADVQLAQGYYYNGQYYYGSPYPYRVPYGYPGPYGYDRPYYRRYYHHHHHHHHYHHHHHHGAFIGIPGVGGLVLRGS
jgi:hypothetical protein